MGVLTNVPSLPANITDIVDFTDYTVEVEPLFFPIVMIVIFVISVTKTSDYGISRALIAGSLITSIFGTFVTILGWMDPKWMYLPGILFGIGLLWRNLESGEGT